MKNHNTFLYKNITLSSLLLKRSEIVYKCERDSVEGLGYRLIEDCYIYTFLNSHCDSISRPYVFASLMEGSHLGAAEDCLSSPLGTH